MKRILFVVVLVAGLTSLWSFDFGGDIANVTGVTGPSASIFSQRDTVTAWFSITDPNYLIMAEGFYSFRGDFSESGNTVLPLRLDVKHLFYQGQTSSVFGPGSLLAWRVGRSDYADPSGKIINDLADGIYLRYNYQTLEFLVQAAYTGLLAQQDANIVISAADYNEYENTDDPPYFAPKRIFGDLRVKAMELLPRLDLSFDLLGQFDLRGQDNMNTFYAELALEGRPLQIFKWRAYGIAEYWADGYDSISLASGAKFQITVPSLAGFVAVASVDWASGTNDTFRQYVPLNQSQVSQIYTAVFSDTLTSNLRLAFRPALGLEIGAAEYNIWRTSSNAPGDSSWPETSPSWYLGTEVLLTADYALTSEWRIGVKAGAFFPNGAEDAYGSGAEILYLGTLEMKFSL